ncbi:DUF4232 domain-containing protein [Streptomyces sp. NPDC021356]|uniref:DUF4232 domain-containing protein n=1 Tax=Streptomyces sp. NPDC021356 TaxID=3154900 RepID=UPI0033F5BFA5
MSVRTRRTRRARLFTATAIAVAALSLTACQSGGDDNAGGSTSAAVPVGSAQSEQPSGAADGGKAPGDAGSGSDAGAGSGSGSGSGSGKGTTVGGGTSKSGGTHASGTGSQAAGSSDESSGKLAKCGAKSLRFKAAEVSRPINHLLLTATNTGSRTCMLPMYPAARFGEAQSVPPVAEDTKPQALTTLEPGQSGYAGVLLSGDGDNGHTVNTLTIPFDDGSIATVALPSKSVYVDDKLMVSYWETDMDTAVDF